MCKAFAVRSGKWEERAWVPRDSCRQQIRARVSHSTSGAGRAGLGQVCANETEGNEAANQSRKGGGGATQSPPIAPLVEALVSNLSYREGKRK